MSYNFENLSPLDFENLSIDLLEKHFSSSIEVFTLGKDWSIDGRFTDDNGNSNIIQCKHYNNFQNLKSILIKEVQKIQKQNKIKKPFNYILVTSLKLTPHKKEKIKQLIPFLKTEQDIFGKDDLNKLLRQYPDIEKAHFKLWLSSSAVLERIFNNDIFTRSEFEKKPIERKMKLYVETGKLKLVHKKLEQNNFCIISGVPGVGKTTLAEMLICLYLQKKYELVVISRDMKEVLNTYSPNKKMIFYYDDFLGTTFLTEHLPKNEDSDLVKFISNIKEDKNKKFILTTREYILKQAIQTYEKIKNSDILDSKFIIELKKYTLQHKAKILFNHLYFSEIDREYLEHLKETKKYRDIVRHENFNPRLIEFMCTKKHLKNVTHNNYSDWCIKSLDNPGKIWEYAFQNISDHSQTLCYLITISKYSSLDIASVEKDFNLFYKEYCKKYNLPIISDAFQKAIKEIEDSFISVKNENNIIESNIIKIEFINPSVNDFLESLIKKDTDLSKNLIEISLNISQVQWIFSIIKSEKENNLFCFLKDKGVQKAILSLTEKESLIENQKKKHRLFSFLFELVSNDFLKGNENFLKTLLSHFTNRFKAPMYKQDISISECLTCFNIFENKTNLYFGTREAILEKAKDAFCQKINGSDLVGVKDFMDKFPSVIDEKTENQVIDKATQTIDEWYDDAPNDSVEMKSVADSIYEIETAFDFDNKKSDELYDRSEELEEAEEAEAFENADNILSNQNMQKVSDISINELDTMFSKL